MKKGILNLLFSIVILFGGNLVFGQETEKSTKSDPNVPIFEIKNDLGQTVFAVYPGGVHIFVDDTQLKATGGGFKVGRIGTEKATLGDIFTVVPGEVNVYIDNPLKATGGGFKVGRVGTEKATGSAANFLSVTPDSTRIYVEETSNNGFAVGKIGASDVTDFLHLTPENYFIGDQSGENTSEGLYNIFIGYRSGFANISGSNNIFLGFGSGEKITSADNNIMFGYEAGKESTTGIYNVLFGNRAGYFNNGNYNIFIGYEAGYNNVADVTDSRTSHWNTFIGYQAGKGNTFGWHNLAIGYLAGLNNQTATNQFFIGNYAGENLTGGYGNSFIGHGTGRNSTDCLQNTFVGYWTGYGNTTGDNNVYLGYATATKTTTSSGNVIIGSQAGTNLTVGGGNVFIGYGAGYSETGSNKLYINNSSAINPLIFGDFKNDRIVINGDSTENTQNYTFYVNGSAGGVSAWNSLSDARLKSNIITIPNALGKILKLRGVNFNWLDKKVGGDKTQVGFIAQEVEKILPEVVSNINDNYTMQYAPITALLVEAMKEQQQEIERLKLKVQNIEEIKNENEQLRTKLAEFDKLKEEIDKLKKITEDLLIQSKSATDANK